ncbi:MAG TPA: TetR/AcrR family transcriptional regulator [Blastocatellia bacterium]|nr:TetR/AcrR family transcriptional regulator [Blastocatellia bacterium]
MKTKTPFKLSALDEPNRLGEIYRAAALLICEKGYDATSMNDIAEAVGITKAGVYHHIEGKKDLLFRIMNFGMDELDEFVIFPARAIADPESRLRAIVTNHVRLITSHITPQGYNPVTIVVDEVAGLTPEHRRKIDQRKRAYVDLIRETLKQLRKDGKLREVDVTVATFSLLGAILWLSRWYHPDGHLTPEQIVEEISKITLGGVLRPRFAPQQ